jgi:hypothetical protein
MIIAKFKRVVSESPFEFLGLDRIAIRRVNLVTKIPGLRELFTSAIRAELVPGRSKVFWTKSPVLVGRMPGGGESPLLTFSSLKLGPD